MPMARHALRSVLFALLGFALAPSVRADALLVCNKGDASVSIVDPASGRELGRVSVGKGPHEVAVSPSGALAVATNYGGASEGSTLSVIDIAKRRVVRTIDLSPFLRPHGVAFLPLDEDRVVVTAEVDGAFLVVNVRTGRIERTVNAGADVHLVAVSPDGAWAYGAGIRSGVVARAALDDSGDGAWDRLTTRSVSPNVEAIALLPQRGELWVGDNDDDVVRIFDARTLAPLASIEVGRTPIRLAASPDGRFVAVSCLASGEAAIVDAETRTVRSRVALAEQRTAGGRPAGRRSEATTADADDSEGAPRPIGLLVGPDGLVYVSCSGLDHVAVVDPDRGAVVRRIATGAGPDGLAWARRP